MWDHARKISAIVLRMSQTMKDMPHPFYLSVKELLVSPTWKYLHSCPDRSHTHEPPKVIVNGENEYTEHFNISGKFTCMFSYYIVS